MLLFDDYASDERVRQQAHELALALCECPRVLLRLTVQDAPVLTIRTLAQLEWFKPGLLVFPRPKIHPYGLPAASTVDVTTRRHGGTHATLALVGLETFREDTIQRLSELIRLRKAPRYVVGVPSMVGRVDTVRLAFYAQTLGMLERGG
jgi:hypothetical protein